MTPRFNAGRADWAPRLRDRLAAAAAAADRVLTDEHQRPEGGWG